VTGTVSTGFQGRFSLSDLNSQAAQTRLSGDLELTPDSIEGAFSGEISDLSQLAAQSSGAASFTAEISGSPARPNLEATVEMAEGRLFDRQVENASIALSGAPSETGWRGALTLDGAFAGKPLAGGAEADYDMASSVLSVP